ncbi:MAG: hypothetical protein Q9225_006327 [Loekoesia sp. 1 TL-2023]
MAQEHQNLFEFLTHPNPRVDCRQCRKGSNTTPGSNRSLRACPSEIREWEDFGVSFVDAAYGGTLRAILDRSYPLRDYSNLPSFPFREICDEDSLEGLLILWNWQVVSSALEASQKHIWEDPSHQAVYMVRGGQALYLGGGIKKGRSGIRRPDWAGVQRLDEEQRLFQPHNKPRNILPGDTKLSSKWNSSQIEKGKLKTRPKKNWYRPISQIYDYCRRANARYCYLFTDQELVVMRLDIERSDVGLKSRSRRGTFLYKAIPWNDQDATPGENGEAMTVNLALWLLHLAAVRDSKITDDLRLLEEPRSSDESDALTGSQEQSNTIPNRSPTEEIITGAPNLSFRSEALDIRNRLAGVSIGSDNREISQPLLEPRRKRGIDEAPGDVTRRKRRRSSRPSKKRF